MPAQLLITLHENGQIQVEGPLENRILCYGLLECARDALRDMKPAEPKRIVPAGFVPFPKNGG
jgi:hypothetical protein